MEEPVSLTDTSYSWTSEHVEAFHENSIYVPPTALNTNSVGGSGGVISTVILLPVRGADSAALFVRKRQ